MTPATGVVSVRGLIEQGARLRPDAPFLISPETERILTFGELQRQSLLFSVLLSQQGLKHGDKVAFLMDNGLATGQMFLGAMYGGFVAVPLNVRAGVSQLSYTLDHCDASVVFVSDEYRGLIEAVMAGVARPVQVIGADLDQSPAPAETPKAPIEPVVPGPEAPALLMYTSGSTGQPKAAVHSHRTLLAHAKNSIAAHQLTPSDRSLMVLPLYHVNAECVTLLPTLMSGGSVVVPHGFIIGKFWEWLDDYRCTWSAVVPTIISQLLDWRDPRAGSRDAAFQRIRFLRSSSAPLAPSLQREFLEKFPVLLIQAMGSSEAGNVFSNPLPPGQNKIGTPGLAWGFETRVVDREGLEVPPGEPGEILLRGPAIMQGYYKQPEDTAAVLDREGWLHTGDLAHRDEDGYFFVAGRTKEIVIKGGVNIAPRQIDDVLESHPAVLEAAAVGVPDHYMGEDLVAFVVLRSDAACDEKELLSLCEARLGAFKTPTRIYFANDLPKGPSGKVQRQRLRDEASQAEIGSSGWQVNPAAQLGPQIDQNGAQAATSSIENIIAETWNDVLGRPHVDRDANFFALGGNSLRAIQCVSRLRERIPVSLSLSDIFENATVAEQALLVAQRLRHDRTSHPASASPADRRSKIPLRERGEPCPLSPAQRRLWFLEQSNPGVPIYNESEAVRLKGELKVDELERAVNMVVARHESLRTTFPVSGGEPVMLVHDNWPVRFKRMDLSGLSHSERQTQVEDLLVQEPRRQFHLENEPGFRATVLRLGPREHVFILMLHHLVCDRLSIGILWREMAAAYAALCSGECLVQSALQVQYGDYAACQHRKIRELGVAEDLSFWMEKLRGAAQLLELPSDRPRPPTPSYSGAKRRFRLEPVLTKALQDFCRRETTSLFNLFTAALNTLLFRYTGQQDILLGIPIADREEPELQSMIGLLIDTQVLRSELSPDMTFRDLLTQVKQGMLELYRHRAVPFDRIVRELQPDRNTAYSPLFQVMINWRDRDSQAAFIGLKGLEVEPLLAESRTSKNDLTLFVTDAGEEIQLEVEYSTELFDEARIARMIGHYRTLLVSAVGNPDRRIAELQILTSVELQQMLVEWNRTEAAYPKDRPLHHLIEEQAARTPDKVAAIFAERELTYRQLEERAGRLAYRLQRMGVGPNVLVAICVERSLEMLVALLGTLKAGGAYVPLDPEWPSDRLAFMLDDCRPRVLVTLKKAQASLSFDKARTICLEPLFAENSASEGGELQQCGHQASDLAYVLYTSGSSGKPKGVQISHRAFVNFLCAMQREPGLTPDDTLLAVTTLSFDIAGLELFLPLITGARVVIASREAAADATKLSSLVKRWSITLMQATPASWQLLLAAGWTGSRTLKILCGGEAWSSKLAHQLSSRCKSLWNMYGPTETTVWSSVTRVEVNQPVLIGPPIANTTFYILDACQQLVPVGLPGELYIGGEGLADGYLNRPELTAERFLRDAFSRRYGARLYRTGDVVQRHPDGRIQFLHRSDQQVKLRGFRIEIGEIEAALKEHSGVADSVVMLRGDDATDKSLAAYVVPVDSRFPPGTRELRDWLKKKLPSYFIPASFLVIKEMPLMVNGKIDRKALSLLDRTPLEAPRAESVSAPASLEMHLTRIWEKLLDAPVGSVHENFFDLGGHSLLAVRMISEVNLLFNTGLTVADFLQTPTIAGMGRLLEKNSAAIRDPLLIPLRPGSRPGTVVLLGTGVGICRLGQALDGPSIFAAHVPFAVCGTRLPVPKGYDAPPTLAEVGLAYADLIQKGLDGGPCVLVGHSFTGLLAFEVAHRLAAKGRSIEMVVLLDASAEKAPLWWKLKSLTLARARARMLRTGSAISRWVAGTLARGPAAAAEPCYQSLDEMPPETFMRLVQYARKDYQLLPINSRAVLFRARDSHAAHLHAFDPSLGWKGLFNGGLEIVEMPGDHSTMLLHSNLPGLAGRLQQHLATIMTARQPPAKATFSDGLSVTARARRMR